MDCPEDKLCYDSHLHSLCEYTDYCDDVSISEAIKVAIKALDPESVTEFADRCKECGAEIGRSLAALTKIQTIVNEWEKDTWTDGLSYKCMIQISNLLEEGKTTIKDVIKAADYGYLDKDITFRLENNLQKSSISYYKDIKFKLKQFLMDNYDIRPSLSEKTVEEMFKKGAEFISLEEQAERDE